MIQTDATVYLAAKFCCFKCWCDQAFTLMLLIDDNVVRMTKTHTRTHLYPRFLSSPEGVGGQADVLEGVVSKDVEGEEGQRDEASDQPRQPYGQVGVSGGGRPAGRMQDQLVTLQSNQHQGEDRDCH